MVNYLIRLWRTTQYHQINRLSEAQSSSPGRKQAIVRATSQFNRAIFMFKELKHYLAHGSSVRIVKAR
jgi:hypothetical protein